MAFYDNLVTSTVVSRDDSGINVELRQYLNQAIIPRHNDPLKYWQSVKHAYSVRSSKKIFISYCDICSF